ncbi:hypothetical protein [Streptomyces subrutilus]|uniref:Uncharacterized protein n=1 Tax=Streptomyces subrutilus TaxID=36818 RepID=A0A1E5PX50_9ACTN|nr:hypothetical protein [Streptomyces subrutilus]OEJ34178.1 hypothetical protein BGK67_25115 [Streptomyces subrutilus]
MTATDTFEPAVLSPVIEARLDHIVDLVEGLQRLEDIYDLDGSAAEACSLLTGARDTAMTKLADCLRAEENHRPAAIRDLRIYAPDLADELARLTEAP